MERRSSNTPSIGTAGLIYKYILLVFTVLMLALAMPASTRGKRVATTKRVAAHARAIARTAARALARHSLAALPSTHPICYCLLRAYAVILTIGVAYATTWVRSEKISNGRIRADLKDIWKVFGEILPLQESIEKASGNQQMSSRLSLCPLQLQWSKVPASL